MPHDPPNVLLNKARDDEHLASLVINDNTVTDERIGFFCPQALEKAFKAVLSYHGVVYRRNHDFTELLALFRDNAIAYPPSLAESDALTPFAAQMRYDYLPPEAIGDRPFDRMNAIQLVRTALGWADGVIHQP